MTYLKRSSILIIISLLLGLLYFSGVNLIFLIALIFSLLLLFTARKKRNLQIIEEKGNGLLFSPVSGVIKSIKEIDQYTHIHLKRELLDEWGVYMPSCGKIEEVLEVQGQKTWFFMRARNYTNFSRTRIRIKSKLGKYDMHIINSKFSSFDCWIDSGDYGFSAARLGVIKGSFNLILVIPKDFSVVMTEAEVLKSGKSIIAANTAVHS